MEGDVSNAELESLKKSDSAYGGNDPGVSFSTPPRPSFVSRESELISPKQEHGITTFLDKTNDRYKWAYEVWHQRGLLL